MAELSDSGVQNLQTTDILQFADFSPLLSTVKQRRYYSNSSPNSICSKFPINFPPFIVLYSPLGSMNKDHAHLQMEV